MVTERSSARKGVFPKLPTGERQIVVPAATLCFLEAHVDRYASPQATSWGDRTLSRPSTPAMQTISVSARQLLRSAAGALAGERDDLCAAQRCRRLQIGFARLLVQWMKKATLAARQVRVPSLTRTQRFPGCRARSRRPSPSTTRRPSSSASRSSLASRSSCPRLLSPRPWPCRSTGWCAIGRRRPS